MIIKVNNTAFINLDQIRRVEVYTQTTADEGHVFALDFDNMRVWMKDSTFTEIAFRRIFRFIEEGRKVTDISDCVRGPRMNRAE